MPFLSVITDQAPTAELRPPDRNQTDEEDMMPYPVLNRIEQIGLAEGKSVEEILEVLEGEFPEYRPESLTVWIDRFYRRWRHNQWKRFRYALSFHLDDSSLSGAQWRDFPALSGE